MQKRIWIVAAALLLLLASCGRSSEGAEIIYDSAYRIYWDSDVVAAREREHGKSTAEFIREAVHSLLDPIFGSDLAINVENEGQAENIVIVKLSFGSAGPLLEKDQESIDSLIIGIIDPGAEVTVISHDADAA
jgi:microcompartment protein CcmK/EutM